MKKPLLFILIIVVLATSLTVTTCSKSIPQETVKTTQQEKLFNIKVYNMTLAGNIIIGKLAEELSVTANSVLEMVITGSLNLDINKICEVSYYTAKEIVEFNEKNIRFIDSTSNKEQFISADYIEVQQR